MAKASRTVAPTKLMRGETSCVIVPMFNEATVIGAVVSPLLEHFDEVVCVDDGSTDDSSVLADHAGARVIKHGTNFGQGAALQTGIEFGLRCTDAQFFVTFDADGQHRVADAQRMLRLAQRDRLDVVLGSRFLANAGHSVPRSRRLLLRGAIAVTRRTTGLRLTDTHNGLRVFSRRFAESLQIQSNGMAHASEILDTVARGGWSFQECAVNIDYTDYSRSKGQSALNAVNIAFDMIAARVGVSP